MGAAASKLKPGDNPQVCVSKDPQVCVRKHGEEICPLHPGYKVTALCSECNIVVCFGCITSHEHKGHTLINLKDCLRDLLDTNISKRINDIDYWSKDISNVQEEIKQRQE